MLVVCPAVRFDRCLRYGWGADLFIRDSTDRPIRRSVSVQKHCEENRRSNIRQFEVNKETSYGLRCTYMGSLRRYSITL
jgi:hypothetical protein